MTQAAEKAAKVLKIRKSRSLYFDGWASRTIPDDLGIMLKAFGFGDRDQVSEYVYMYWHSDGSVVNINYRTGQGESIFIHTRLPIVDQ